MVVKAGNKQTEAGVIPRNWDVMSLGKFLALQRGHDLNENQRRPGNIPVMGSAGQNGFHDTAIAKGPGVVIGRSGASFGQAHYCKNDYWPHNTAIYVTDFRGNDPCFSYYFLKSMDFRRYNSGGAQQSLNRNFINPIIVAIPHTPEQRAIATALSDADAHISSLEQVIAKKRDLEQAAIQELLTGKRRLPGFYNDKGHKLTDIGKIPEDWNTSKIKDLAKSITVGFVGSMAPLFEKEGVPLLRGQNILPNLLDLTNLKYISRETHRQWIKSSLYPGDVVLVRVGYPGTACVIPKNLGELNAASLVIVRPNHHLLNSNFLCYLLNSPWGKRQIQERLVGGAQQVVNTSTTAELIIPQPPLPEQAAVVTVLTNMDAELATLEQKRDKTKAIKQGMMQELLTGRIRLMS